MAYRWTFKKDPPKLEKILGVIHNKMRYNKMSCNKIWRNDVPSEKVLYRTCRKLFSLIESYIMEEVNVA